VAFLEVEDLKKTYSTGEEALKGVTFSIESRDFVSIIGPSGGGKSTLLRCINRLVEPTSGRILFKGQEVNSLNSKELKRIRRSIGMIFQEFNLIDRMSVIQNVLTGRLGYTGLWRSLLGKFHKHDVERAAEICERVGMKDHIYKRADELSGGQRQRVGIARAIIQSPDFLLVDEPTSSLDIKIQHEVMDLIHKISKEDEVPVLISIHNVELAKEYAARIIGLQDGKKVFEGTAKEVDRKALDTIYKYD